MTTTQTKPAAPPAEGAEQTAAFRDVCVRLAMPEPPTDELLERIAQLNPGWKFELGPNGELEVRVIAGGSSSDISGEFVRQIGNWRVSGGGVRVRDPDGTYRLSHPILGERTRAPDVSWVSPALLQSTPREDRPSRGFWRLCPTFVIEVRSPSDSLAGQQSRTAEWLEYGAALGWLVDPLDQTVWIYRPGQAPEQLDRPDALSGESVLEGLVVDLAEIWQFAGEDGQDELD